MTTSEETKNPVPAPQKAEDTHLHAFADKVADAVSGPLAGAPQEKPE